MDGAVFLHSPFEELGCFSGCLMSSAGIQKFNHCFIPHLDNQKIIIMAYVVGILYISEKTNDTHIDMVHWLALRIAKLHILECEVRWALGIITMNKSSGGDGIPVELFQILKDDGVHHGKYWAQ